MALITRVRFSSRNRRCSLSTCRVRSFLAKFPPLIFVESFNDAWTLLLVHRQIVCHTENPRPDIVDAGSLPKGAIEGEKDLLHHLFRIVAIPELPEQIAVDRKLVEKEQF